MKTIKVNKTFDIPDDFTGIAEWPDGSKYWYLNGEAHRGNDRPAVEYPDGTKAWYINGNLERINGAAIEYANGSKRYRVGKTDLTEKQYKIFYFMWENTVKEKTPELMKIYVRLAIVKDRQI
jgi:hypothetical protein